MSNAVDQHILRPLVTGPSAWIGADADEASGRMDLPPFAHRDRRDRNGDRQSAWSRHRGHRPGRFSSADTWSCSGAAARRGPERPRLRADSRAPCREAAYRRECNCLLGHRHVFRQRTVAERHGSRARTCTRSGPVVAGPQRPHLPDHRAAEFPYRFLRHRRTAVSEDREVGRAVVADQLDVGLQRHGAAASGPGMAAVPADAHRPARRGARGQARPGSRPRSTTITTACCRRSTPRTTYARRSASPRRRD